MLIIGGRFLQVPVLPRYRPHYLPFESCGAFAADEPVRGDGAEPCGLEAGGAGHLL